MVESIVASTLGWISSSLLQEADILFGVKEEVSKLQQELELLQQFLQDADSRQEEGEVRTLIRQIRQLTHDAEDVIDTYILRDEWRHAEHKHLRLAGYLCSVPNIYRVGKKIKVIQRGVKRVTERLNACGMRKTLKAREHHNRSQLPPDERHWRHQPSSYSYDDNNGEYVVGLEKDIRMLVDVLMGEGNVHINVLSIVGMGGCGKTTLARKLYNHPYVKECFRCKAWVFISQEWSTEHVLLQLLRKVAGPKEMIDSHAKLSVEELVDNLRNILRNKSYLVVLDDVWSRMALEEILPAFPRDDKNKGSKVIITTRNQEIIQLPNLQKNIFVHEPRLLCEEEGWQLLAKLALHHSGNYNVKDFKTLGKEMLKKCCGLPLAIAALAGILNARESIAEWQMVNETVRSRVMEGTQMNQGKSVQNLLSLSYDDLPDNLKPCFQYLCVFPEDCQIPTGTLSRMWIAEGLVTAHQDLSPEDVATQYLEELSDRFMIKIVRTNFKGAIKAIQVHDLLRDLCVKKAKEENFLQMYTATNKQNTSYVSTTATQSRRAALHSSILFPTQDSNLRSLVLLTRSSILHSDYTSKESVDITVVHKSFMLLRLLNIWGIKTATGTLPTEIGLLVHLRYLGIRASNVIELPRSIGKLRNLLTLDFRNIDSDNNAPIQIPNVLNKLVLLRNLFLPVESPWSPQELQLSGLTNLQILWGVKCGVNGDITSDWFSREMVELSTSLKKLKVIVSTNNDLEASFRCPSLIFDRLNTFHCEWKNDVVLEQVSTISHNKHLHKLVLAGPINLKSKLSVLLPRNLITLELRDSIIQNEDPMLAIGSLTHLKLLRLSNSYEGTEFLCKENSFPVLEELYLDGLPNLNTWKILKGAMASLKKIEILWCKKLLHLPQGLAFVTTLQQFEFFGMEKDFVRAARVSGWSKKGFKLPQNMAAIIDQCDSRVDISSISKLYDQLITGVFMNNKTQKYWVMKQNEHYYNCFTLYAKQLSLYKLNDPLQDQYPGFLKPLDNCLEWIEEEDKESDGASVVVGKVMCSTRASLQGKLDTRYLALSPTATYEIAYTIMATSQVPLFLQGESSLCCHKSKKHFEILERNTWIQVCVGKPKSTCRNAGRTMSFSLDGVMTGLKIKGVTIKPVLKGLMMASNGTRDANHVDLLASPSDKPHSR